MAVINKDWQLIKPEDVLALNAATKEFLCPIDANIFGIDFTSFKIRDVEEDHIIFDVNEDVTVPADESGKPADPSKKGVIAPDIDARRSIRYNFGPDFLKLKVIGTTLEFSVGEQPVKNFRMIERHYFKGKLVKSFDFNMPFCMPRTTNTWEVIYEMPDLSDTEMREIIEAPYEMKSDSFYFVDGRLVMQNKAEYSYAPFT
uniref:GMP phosphodiesterase delta subunit domain-containing protein n=1 Tax=Chromera velia CCMP2878 TaxID=1169474 RepID=A0A0G4H3R2_9ALVE|mmetsp:Transcript_20943/g.41808  ORF Transcript_20943/g.41808 Transcript_20943/m.41808 type:complete len:201 (-) Transcript_20943:385-987(-)|eukprot:Cvel_5637.t1-p1 / transcript=Cvel_5637.t1 / gene=Cvel_5637 / organism=Chromera_velia_CCMP2878 / gene_product=Protein unc-119 homolog B, putative / transcript_product=Protein unc-119 homolog B, putative / location=Cvel_scaffold265:103342-106531(-) / protein_length=200 / sequence_SO=supercontig / SO=protein_coding / is_pseudo=false